MYYLESWFIHQKCDRAGNPLDTPRYRYIRGSGRSLMYPNRYPRSSTCRNPGSNPKGRGRSVCATRSSSRFEDSFGQSDRVENPTLLDPQGEF